MILNFFMRLLEIVMLVALTVESFLALVLMVEATSQWVSRNI